MFSAGLRRRLSEAQILEQKRLLYSNFQYTQQQIGRGFTPNYFADVSAQFIREFKGEQPV